MVNRLLGKSMILRQFASVADCVLSFMLARKCRPGISEFCSKFTFLLEQQIKFVLRCIYGFVYSFETFISTTLCDIR